MHAVQFIHPGPEFPVSNTNSDRRPDGKYDVHWNTGRHCRRFVKHAGNYIDNANTLKEATLLFWTEWEGPTIATELNAPRGAIYARYLHEIQYPIVPQGMENSRRECCGEDEGGYDGDDNCCDEGLQNTDPCVFGETFKYSNCQQSRNGVLRWLDENSLILFVSRISGRYYLDTAFVTQKGVSYCPAQVGNLTCSDQYKALTLNRLSTSRYFTFYRGVGYAADIPVYSFAPARLFDEGAINSGRCLLNVDDINKVAGCEMFSNGLTQKFKCTVAGRDMINRVWTEVVRQVRAHGFVLGVKFNWPTQC